MWMAESMYNTLALSLRAVTPVTAENDMVDGPLSTFRVYFLVLQFRWITSPQDTGLLWGVGYTYSLLINAVIP